MLGNQELLQCTCPSAGFSCGWCAMLGGTAERGGSIQPMLAWSRKAASCAPTTPSSPHYALQGDLGLQKRTGVSPRATELCRLELGGVHAQATISTEQQDFPKTCVQMRALGHIRGRNENPVSHAISLNNYHLQMAPQRLGQL